MPYALLTTPTYWKVSNTNARLLAFALSLALDPTFGIHSHKILDTAQPCYLLKPNWKLSSSHSTSAPANIKYQYPVFPTVTVCMWSQGHICYWSPQKGLLAVKTGVQKGDCPQSSLVQDWKFLSTVNDLLNAMDKDKISVPLLLALSAVLMLLITRFCFPILKLSLVYRSPVVLIISSGQSTVCGCQQFCFFLFTSVWCSTGLSAGTCAVCFVHYSFFRHHSKSFSQPSAFCRWYQLQKLTPSNDIQSLTHNLQSCTGDTNHNCGTATQT